MERSEFQARLEEAGRRAVEFARQFVRQSLPNEVALLVLPNQSYDGEPRVGDEVVFPNDSLPGDQYHGPWSAVDVVDFLWRNGKVPEWVDVSVRAEDGSRTLVQLRCCGRFTASDDLLYHSHTEDIPPFHVKSPNIPPKWDSVEKSGRFDLYWQSKK